MSGVDITGTIANPDKRVPSDEQQAIIEQPPTSTIIVEAGAGSGKTTTLVDYAYRWRQYRGLYLAFNKEIAESAKSRFPSWITAMTGHSYAYRALGVAKHKDRLVGRIRRQTIRDAGFDIRTPHMSPDRMMRCILMALTNFCIDAGNELLPEHCGLAGMPSGVQSLILPKIAAVVKRFMDYENSGLPFTHDIYMKTLEMHGSIGDVADYIMIDEAQDSNACMISLAKKSGKPLIFIGDTKQSIYNFRGAYNAMDKVDGVRLPLSMSWRFGQEAADLANHILSYSDEPPTHPLRGRPDRSTSIELYEGMAPSRSFILSRTNARLFEGLIAIPPNMTFYVAGGFDTLANQLRSAWSLSRNDQYKVTDPYVRAFASWDEMVEEAGESDPDAKKLVKIVKEYGDQVPVILDRLRSFARPNHEDARILLSTAHKAKGLEAEVVVILDDFATPDELKARLLDNKIKPIDYEQEINLLYVACSRAQRRLLLPPSLHADVKRILEGNGK